MNTPDAPVMLKGCPFSGMTPQQPIQQANGQWRIYGSGYWLQAPSLKSVVAAWNQRSPAKREGQGAVERAQRLQDHMEQHHGICLSASEWDAAIAALTEREA